MAVKRCQASIDVVQAAQIRVENIFKNGLPVYLAFSGGKDSLTLAQIVVNLIQQGRINPSQLVVQFVDEEAIFPCIEKTVLEWRKKFIMLGAKFEWYCVEVKHYNCFNELTNDESFICWDIEKESTWVRRPPSFAIRTHKLLRHRKDSYQEFMERVNVDGICIIGIRTAESVQRLQYIAVSSQSKTNIPNNRKLYPIYDWRDNDVWLYLKNENVVIPDIYLYLWQIGSHKNRLRVSQFFSIDTAKTLVQMNEYYPNLMERIIAREPNAYLASLYWDSEMFGRSSGTRRKIEAGEKERDYKAELLLIFNNPKDFTSTKHKKHVFDTYRNFFMRISVFATNKDFKRVYDGLISGDPKLRTLRALYQQVYGAYIDNAKKEVISNGK